jgi:hypothetical protein
MMLNEVEHLLLFSGKPWCLWCFLIELAIASNSLNIYHWDGYVYHVQSYVQFETFP